MASVPTLLGHNRLFDPHLSIGGETLARRVFLYLVTGPHIQEGGTLAAQGQLLYTPDSDSVHSQGRPLLRLF
jgi:hypothetical protein